MKTPDLPEEKPSAPDKRDSTPPIVSGQCAVEQFRDAIQASGLTPPETIEADGKLRRFASNGKRGDDSGRYLLHLDGIPAGWIGDYRTGLSQNWRADIGRALTPGEEAAHRAKVETMRSEREADEARRRAEAAKKSAAVWKAATPATNNNPYLARKQVSPVATLREIDAGEVAAILGYSPKSKGEPLTGRLLVVPVKVDDAISTLELIDGDGRKSAVYGGVKAGGYWAAGRLPEGDGSEPLQIFEGVATTLSGRESNERLSVAALSAGNLPAVAKVMRQRYPTRPIVIGADLVKATGEPDPHAIEAARAVGGKLAIPHFGSDRDPDMTDFNDMAVICGPEAVAQAMADASAPARGEHQPGADDAPAGEYARDVNLIRASDVAIEPITWLWNGWLAAGKMHVFGGAPGTGKTTIAMGLAATVTTRGCWPDGTRSMAGNVVIWSGEDDPADTLIPRLALSGADLSRVFFIDDIREGNERRSFDPARDAEPLQRKLREVGDVRLLIVDPLVSAVTGEGNSNPQVRRSLQPLVDIGRDIDCAVLGITHFRKSSTGSDPVERINGSIAYGALARVVLVAAKHQEEREDGRTVRLFCRAKSNNGPDDGGFEYDLHQAELKTHPGIFASTVRWGDAVEGGARELLATADATGDDGEGGTLADAKRFLADLLADGSMRAGDVFKDADQAGYSKRSLQRAANAIKVERHKDGMRGGWIWRLPPKMPNIPEGAIDARLQTLAPLAPSAASSLVEVEI